MSLNREEQQRTSGELHANIQLCGTPPEQLAEQLGFSADQLEDTLNMGGACQPQDVWLLRDHLQDLVLAQGRTPVPYSVLTEQARRAAAVWFPLHPLSRP
ncbi:DUF2316 family protein [Streptacidiphilus sp. PAMC 29251]